MKNKVKKKITGLDCFVANVPRNDNKERVIARNAVTKQSQRLDCFVANAPRNDGGGKVGVAVLSGPHNKF